MACLHALTCLTTHTLPQERISESIRELGSQSGQLSPTSCHTLVRYATLLRAVWRAIVMLCCCCGDSMLLQLAVLATAGAGGDC